MSRKKDEEFHDSDCDIFDLFNVTGGILRQDGLLDISQLDKYSEQEKEELNAPRLREIWEHTATTGCLHCKSVIKMLGEIRGALGEEEDAEESFDERAEDSDADVSNSVSH